MPACLTSASPFAADCQLFDALWSYVVLTAIWSALAYAVVVARPAGLDRWWCGAGVIFVAGACLDPFAELLVYGSFIPADAIHSGAIMVAAGLAWCECESSAPAGPRAKTRFDVGEYVLITVLLVAGESALALLHVEVAGSGIARHIASSPILTVDGVAGRVTMFGLFFGLSQVGIGAAARALAKSLQCDWRVVEGSPYRRTVLLAAGIFPIGLCLVPAVHYDVLLGSVLLRLAVVAFAWRSTREAPADNDATFLSWSTFRAGRELLSALARGAAARVDGFRRGGAAGWGQWRNWPRSKIAGAGGQT